jgi:acetyltransferase-like isoleucine patch superfamily enzyme
MVLVVARFRFIDLYFTLSTSKNDCDISIQRKYRIYFLAPHLLSTFCDNCFINENPEVD